MDRLQYPATQLHTNLGVAVKYSIDVVNTYNQLILSKGGYSQSCGSVSSNQLKVIRTKLRKKKFCLEIAALTAPDGFQPTG